MRSCAPDACGLPATPQAVSASQLARSEVNPYTWLHEIPRTLKATVSQIGRLAVRLESPPRQEKRTSPNRTHLSDPARQLPDRRLLGSWSETGFEEIGARAALRTTAFPPSGLLARNSFRLARHPSNEHQPTPLGMKMTETVSNVLAAFVICNAKAAGWLEPPFRLSSAFDDAKIPLCGLVENFERWPVQVTIIRGYRLL